MKQQMIDDYIIDQAPLSFTPADRLILKTEFFRLKTIEENLFLVFEETQKFYIEEGFQQK